MNLWSKKYISLFIIYNDLHTDISLLSSFNILWVRLTSFFSSRFWNWWQQHRWTHHCWGHGNPLWSKLAGSESRSGQLRHSSLLHRFFRQKQVLIVEKFVRFVKHLVSSTWAQPPSTWSPVLSENYTCYNW